PGLTHPDPLPESKDKNAASGPPGRIPLGGTGGLRAPEGSAAKSTGHARRLYAWRGTCLRSCPEGSGVPDNSVGPKTRPQSLRTSRAVDASGGPAVPEGALSFLSGASRQQAAIPPFAYNGDAALKRTARVILGHGAKAADWRTQGVSRWEGQRPATRKPMRRKLTAARPSRRLAKRSSPMNSPKLSDWSRRSRFRPRLRPRRMTIRRESGTTGVSQ